MGTGCTRISAAFNMLLTQTDFGCAYARWDRTGPLKTRLSQDQQAAQLMLIKVANSV